jgi:ComF family protein
MKVDSIWRALCDRLLPQRCIVCAQPSASALCAPCRRELPWNLNACPRCARPMQTAALCAECARQPPPFDAAWSLFRYAPPIDWAILGLKYHADFRAGHWLAHEMATALALRGAPLPELLLAVPLHRGRVRRRGYNQALELARVLGRELGIPFAATAARRRRATEDQIGKSAAARRRNVRGAFAVDSARVRDRHIALIDDVMTTGATLAELARVCRAAGARAVEVWAAARAV